MYHQRTITSILPSTLNRLFLHSDIAIDEMSLYVPFDPLDLGSHDGHRFLEESFRGYAAGRFNTDCSPDTLASHHSIKRQKSLHKKKSLILVNSTLSTNSWCLKTSRDIVSFLGFATTSSSSLLPFVRRISMTPGAKQFWNFLK